MSKYPKVITDEVLEKVSRVSNYEIGRDIADTQIEITNLEKEVEGLGLIAEAKMGTADGKMAAFRRDGKQTGLNERREFVEFLQAVLVKRGSK